MQELIAAAVDVLFALHSIRNECKFITTSNIAFIHMNGFS